MDVEGVKIAITKKHIIQGRVISCKIATPKLPSSTATKMFVGGLPLQVTEADLEQYFQQWRTVDRCSVIVNPQTGRSRGFGFVTFYDEESINCIVEVKLAKPSSNEANKQAVAASAASGEGEEAKAENAGEQANNSSTSTTPTASNATPSSTPTSSTNSASSHSPKSKRLNASREKPPNMSTPTPSTDEKISNNANNWTSAANLTSFSAYNNTNNNNNINHYVYPNQELYENLLRKNSIKRRIVKTVERKTKP